MLAFQIHDNGESFYSPLENRPVTIGSAPDADVRLHGAAVAGLHVRIEPGEESCELHILDGASVVRLNGAAVEGSRATMHLGDRLDVGGSALVLGQQLRRPNTAEDVLQEPGRPRDTRPRSKPGLGRLLIAVVVLAALGGVIAIGLNSANQVHLPYKERDDARRLRQGGDFVRARGVLKMLRNDWAKEEPRRIALIAEAERQVNDTEAAYSALRAEVLDDVLKKNRFEELRRLKLRAKKAATQGEREAAHLLAARFTDSWLLAVEEAKKALPRPAPGSNVAKGTEEQASKPEQPKPMRPTWLDSRLDVVRKLQAEGQFVQAIEIVRQTMPEVPSEFANELREELDAVRTATRKEMKELLAKADAEVQQGRTARAVQLLRSNSTRFPAHGDLSDLFHKLAELEASLEAPRFKGGVGGRFVNRPAANASIASLMAQARAAERAGALDAAVERLLTAAQKVQAKDPVMARGLRARIKDLEHVQHLTEEMRGKIRPELGVQMTLADGNTLLWRGMDGHLLVFGSADSPRKVSWFDVPVGSLQQALEKVGAAAPARLGFAVLCYRSNKPALAETVLARFLRQSSTSARKRAVDAIISRGRGEPIDEDGYVYTEGRFTSARLLRVKKLTRKLHGRLGALGNRGTKSRNQAFQAMLESEEQAPIAMGEALRMRQRDLIEKIGRSSFKKQFERLQKRRAELDAARTHALALIFDTKKYFYPFKPPAVSGVKAAEYWVVQKEVDARVAKVEKIWRDKKAKAAVSKALRRQLDFLGWVTGKLRELGEPRAQAADRIAWANAIPPVAILNVRNFCGTVEERDKLLFHMRVEEWNDEVLENLSSAEREQMTITNSYRMMMGRSPLVINKKVLRAARGHAQEMEKMGYFSHFSPNPDRRSPFQRMRLEGYTAGVSENIALSPSAANAHYRWLHSSGHHRNILMPSHTEFGVGNRGKLWVQNFGRGRDFLDDPDFPPAVK